MPPPKKPHAHKKTAAPKAAPPVRVPKRPTPEDRIPRVIENPTLDDHLAVITRAVMQAGMSWAFIDSRWDDYVAAFEDFAIEKVAAYDDTDVDRLMNTDGIIHSKSKIEGTIKNAGALIDIVAEFGSVRAYHESFATYDDARKDAKKRLAFMGDLNTYYWRFRTGATVPDLEEWMKGQERDHPRMREMVTLGRAS
ncbi:MAG: DNA-3-methyladenine glycosylase [Candidatus Eremiobacteraeota bacterium]|nr:DNA-3-methyladenine glycosylase [Candidatus Eremiobacteraeota bacterium]